MSSTKSHVAAAANIPNLSSGQQQQQKDYNTEEHLSRQNSIGLNRRSNMKGKHLTRSHAMRESTSPPRTPTPRASESTSQMSPNGYQQQQHIDIKEGNNSSNNNKLQTQSSATRGSSPTIDAPVVIVTSQHKQQQHTNVSLCNETEFPKLSPPKSKGNNSVNSCASVNDAQNKSTNRVNAGNDAQQSRSICNSSMNYQLHSNDDSNSQQQQQTFIVYDKENNNNKNNQQRITNALESQSSNNNNNNSSVGYNKKANNDDANGVSETHNKSNNNMNASAGNANKNYNQSRQHKKIRAGKELQEALSALFIDDTQSAPNCNSPMNYQLHSNDGSGQQQPFVAYDKENNNNTSSSCNQRRNNNTSDVYNNNITSSNNNNSATTCSNKKSNDDITCTNETHNKATNNMNATSASVNKNYNQSRQQRKLSDTINSIYIDDTQSISICNSPMNYQLHANDAGCSQQQQSFIAYDKENRCPRNDSQNSMNSGDELHYEPQHHQKQQQQQHHQRLGGGGSTKKHRTNSNSKGSKPRLKNMGGSTNNSSVSGGGGIGGGVAAGGMVSGNIDGSVNSSNNTSGFISRVFTNSENSNEQYTDHGGTDLLSFFKETLNKNVKDRQFLLKVEKDLIEFVQEGNRGEIRFPQASSYNRMLIHRTAAFFGMEHNVDTETQQCVIVAPTKNTRIPEIRFKTLVNNNRDDSRKSILKRDTHSFDEPRQSSYLCPERGGMLDRKAKSFEEREEDYDRARSRIFNRSQNESCMGASGSTEDDNNYVSWTSSVEQQQFSRGCQNGKSPDSRNAGNAIQKSNNNFGNYGGPSQSGTPLIRGDSANSNKSMGPSSGNGTRFFSKQDSAGSSNTSWRLSPSSSGTVYHYDPSSMPPPQAMASGNVTNNGAGIYHTSQNNACLQQHTVHNIKKQQKVQQSQSQQQQPHKKIESTTMVSGTEGCEAVLESSTQTINTGDEISASANLSDVNYKEEATCNQDANEECDNMGNDCLSITTTTSAKNYDRIEVQKFKNQATSPNIPLNEKEEIAKQENSSQTPVIASPTQQSQLQQQHTGQTSQAQNRETTPHSSRSTPFSNSDTLTKRSSEESRATNWTQSYQAHDGSTVFHTPNTPNNNSTNSYCTTTTYQQGPDGSVYAVPQGMIYAYPPPVDGEFQGYFMPVFDPSQQRADGTSLLQPGAPAIYPAGSATAMVPVAAYPTTQFAATNGAPIYPGQVIYSSEQFQPVGASLSTTAPVSATTQLQQIPMTTYPIGYPYPYNGYWGQTMAYYVPQQAVPATPILTAPSPTTSGNGGHVAGGVSNNGSNGGISTAGPSINSSNTTNNSLGHVINANTPNVSHSNNSVTTGYQSHVHTIGSASSVVGSSHAGGTTYYGTGRIKRPNPPHFSSTGSSGAHQVLTAASLPNGVATATYQLGHAVPTLTLAAAAPPQTTAGVTTPADLVGSSGAPTTATMYALPQHATIFPANMFPYAANAAIPPIASQSAANMTSQTAILPPPSNPQSHNTGVVGGQENATAGTLHNAHHSNTVITHFYTTTHHHAPHPGIHPGSHPIHAPGPSAIPIIDPASIAGNVAPITPASNATYTARSTGGVNSAGASLSAPSTPHSIPSSSNMHHSQRVPSVFSTPPIIHSNGGSYNSSNSTPQYYGTTDLSHQGSTANTGGANNSNSSHNSYVSSTYEKRNNSNSGGAKKSHSYQSASLSRQNSTNGGGYSGNGKPSPLLNNANGNNNDLRASPSSSSNNSRPHSIKRSGGASSGSVGLSSSNDKPQTPLLSATPNFVGSANNQTSNNNNNSSYQVVQNAEVGANSVPMANVSKPPIRLNAAAAAFRQKGSTCSSVAGSVFEYRRNPTSQRNSPGTNANSNDNSNNNSPNSIHNSSNAATSIAAGCYAPSYIINAQNNISDPTPQHPPPLYITAAPARGPTHIPPHLQSAAATGAAGAATANVPAQTATAVLGGAAAAAAAADVANAAAVAAAAATVAHHHHHQPLLGTYNPGGSGLYFKYGHTYFAHPSVTLQNSRRSPSTDLRPPIQQMAGMYPTVNMMIPAQPRHPGRHPNPNYKGTRPR